MDISELTKLNPVDLNDFKKIEFEIKDVLLSQNFSYIEELLDFINGVLQSKGSEIEAKFPQLYESYQNYWVKLAFATFVLLESVDQDSLLKTRFLNAVNEGINPDDLIKQFYNFYESDEFVKQVFRSLAVDLEQNTEQFGAMPIEIEGRKMLPTLKYWIMDYSKFPSKVAKRGSIERLNYINQSSNTRSLPQMQRQTLLRILKFYDDLNNAERPVVQANRNRSRAIPVGQRMDIKSQIDIQKKLDELKTRAR
ncbi:MAG: hypothetical protein JWO40_829 [Candidatus Doudnabacteria bacterium]|nr:hypothetical protein [Candidatus Doudnabacteria bacterium]